MIKQQNSYSLWLRPTQTQIDELTKIISGLTHRYRGTPFPPHITLLPNISANTDAIVKTCKHLVEQHPAFEIGLEEIAYTDIYYRNLYILAKPESPLINIYEEAKIRLDYITNEEFMPHVSLLYGNLDTKRQHSIKEELADSYSKVFSCQRLDLYNTTGKESEWHLIESFYLKKS